MGTNGDPDQSELSDAGDSGGAAGGDEYHTSKNPELSREDVQFLRAIRDINESPADYPKTEKGTQPASVSAIKEATTLSRSQINYRIGTASNSRGFEEMGYINSFDPPMTESGFGPRSAELTEKGEQRLNEGLRAYGMDSTSGRGDPEVMEKLEDVGARLDDFGRRLDQIERELEEITDTVEAVDNRAARMESREMGAVDEQQAARLRTVIDAMPAFYQAFQLMGMDVREIQETESLDDRDAEALIDSVRSTLDR